MDGWRKAGRRWAYDAGRWPAACAARSRGGRGVGVGLTRQCVVHRLAYARPGTTCQRQQPRPPSLGGVRVRALAGVSHPPKLAGVSHPPKLASPLCPSNAHSRACPPPANTAGGGSTAPRGGGTTAAPRACTARRSRAGRRNARSLRLDLILPRANRVGILVTTESPRRAPRAPTPALDPCTLRSVAERHHVLPDGTPLEVQEVLVSEKRGGCAGGRCAPSAHLQPPTPPRPPAPLPAPPCSLSTAPATPPGAGPSTGCPGLARAAGTRTR